jgi:hypothetical protein
MTDTQIDDVLAGLGNVKIPNGVDDLWTLIVSISKKVNYKVAILLFFMFIFLNSMTFISFCLTGKGMTEGNSATRYGIITQGLILSIFYVVVDILNSSELI